MIELYCKGKLFFRAIERKRLIGKDYSLIFFLVFLIFTSSVFGSTKSDPSPSLPLFTISFTTSNYNGYNISCHGASDGSIDMTLNGAVQPVNIIWSNGETTEDINSLIVGTYTVTVTDFNGDITTDSVTLTQPDAIQIFQTTIANVTCYGGNNGSIDLSLGGGVLPYGFVWSNSELTQNINNLQAGNYSLTITDANNCVVPAGYNVTQPDSISILFSPTDETCGSGNGSISVLASGGTGNLSYLWSTGLGSATINNLNAGTFTVTVTDDSSCVNSNSVSIINIASPIVVVDSVHDVTCFGGSNGEVFITVSGGSIPYSYSWSNTETTEDISNLNSTSYTITVTDNIGCTATASTLVNQPSEILISFNTIDETCGSANGSIAATPTGGTGNIDLLWSTGQTTSSISGLSSGTYTVTATDGAGCTKTETVSIINIAGPGVNIDSIHNVSCNGGNDGAVFISTIGGTAPLSYSWSNSETTEDIINLTSNFYTVTVTDNNNCTATIGANVSEPPALSATTNKTDATCGNSNGIASVIPNGGTGIITFLWSTGATTSSISNLAPGAYTVTCTDANGCAETKSISLVNIPGPSVAVNLVVNVSCNGGNNGFIDINVNGGTPTFSFNWSNGAAVEDVTNLAAGTYTVTVTDFNNCTATTNAIVTEPNDINLNLTGIDATCGNSDGSVTASVSGGTGLISYEWSTGQTTSVINGLLPGTYSVTVTDVNGCSKMDLQTITNIGGPTLSISSFNDVSCNGGNNGSINITVSGGTIPFGFNWSNSQTTEDVNNLSAANYSVVVTDNNNCTTTISQLISEPSAINLIVTPFNATCGNNNGSATANSTGGTGVVNYLWSTGETTALILNLSPGAYTVTATDVNGCTEISSIFIQDDAGPSINITNVNHVTCNGGINGLINISVSGGTQPITYLWSNGFTTEDISNLSTGTYTVTATDNNSCTAQTSVIINEPSPINIGITKTDALCALPVGTATALASGGTGLISYQWSNGAITPVISLLAAGTYTVTATDANNCTSSSSITINNLNGPVLGVNIIINVSCNGGSNGAVDINVTGGTGNITYNWSNGNAIQDLSGVAANTYTVTATDANNCTAVISATVSEPGVININVNGTTATCGNANGTATASASGGVGAFSYVWSTGALTPFVSGLSAATYTVTATDANGCSKIASVNIGNTTAPSISLNSTTNISCFGGSNGAIDISASGGQQPYSFVWSNGATTEDITNLVSSSYTVSVFDQNNCIAITTIQITQPTIISVLTSTTNANCGLNNGTATVSATGGTGAISFLWSTGLTNTTISNLSAATYIVTATDANLCSKSTFANVQLTQGLSVTTIGNNDISCNGGNNGSVNISVNGGTQPFTYLWSNGFTTEDIFSLTAGAYTVTVTDADFCTASIGEFVNQPSQINVNINSSACHGTLSNGTASCNPTGGVGGYTFLWSNGSTSSIITGLLPGTYTVTVTDGNGCQRNGNIIVPFVDPCSVTIDSVVNVNCFGENNGAVYISIQNTQGPVTYTWSNSDVTQDIFNLTANTYTVTMQDSAGCIATEDTVISQPSLLTSNINTTNSTCGNANGEADVTAGGGSPGYSYLWSNFSINDTISNVAAAVYTVTVTDSHGCTSQANASVNNTSGPSIVVDSILNVSCFGGNNGGIFTTITGGTAPIQIRWNGVLSASSDSTNLSSGTYTLKVTDANSCVDSVVITITQPTQLTVNAITTPEACGQNNGTAIAQVNGGTLPYSFQWSGSGVNNDTIIGLSAGVVTVTVTDDNGCVATDNASVANQSGPTVTLDSTKNVSCFGGNNGAVYTTITGGIGPYVIRWNGVIKSNADTLNVVAGTYTILVTDNNGCTSTQSATITQPAAALNVNVITTPESCNQDNGIAVAQMSGGTTPYSFQWSVSVVNNDTVTGLNSGLVVVTVTDNNGCTATDNATVGSQSGPTLTLDSVKNVSCFGGNNGAVYTTISGGAGPYVIRWNGVIKTNTDTINATAGTYTILVTDNNGCTAIQSATITQPAAALSINVVTTPEACSQNDGTAIAQVSGGTTPYNFQWSATVVNNDTITGLASGLITVTVTDVNGCTTTDNSTVGIQTGPSLTIDSTNNVSCFGGNDGAVFTTISGGILPYTIRWNGVIKTNSDSVNATAGTYIILITDANGCTATQMATITQPSAVLTVNVVTNPTACGLSIGSAIAQMSGGTVPYSFQWSASAVNNDTITGLAAGAVTVTVTDANGCIANDNGSIGNQNGPSVTIDSVHNVSCNGGSNGAIYTTITGGALPYVIRWNGVIKPNADTLNAAAGSYIIFVTDANGCTSSSTATITEPSVLAVNVITNPTACSQSIGSAIAQVSGGTLPYNYVWSSTVTNNDTITGLAAGSYTVTVTDGNGCTASDNGTVSNLSGPIVVIDSVKNIKCFGTNTGAVYTTISLGTLPYTIHWNGIIKPNADTVNAFAGAYTILVTDFYGCTSSQATTITQPAAPLAVNVITHPTACGQSIGQAIAQVTAGTLPYSFQWSAGVVNNDTINGLPQGTITVTVTDADGCTASDNGIVGVQSAPVVTIDSVKNISCNGGSNGAIYTTISGGLPPYTIRWNGIVKPNADTLNASPGSYTILVTDANGCTTSQDTIITQPSLLNLNMNSSPCTGGSMNGSATCVATGGAGNYTFLWSNNATTSIISNILPGVYTVTVTDINGCSKTSSSTVLNIAACSITIDSIHNVSCFGGNDGAIYITPVGVLGPLTYLWSNLFITEDLVNVSANVYTVTMIDLLGCIATATDTVHEPALLTGNITTSNSSCGNANGQAVVVANGGTSGYTYLWSNNSVNDTIFNVFAGPYSVTITDTHGCTAQANATVSNTSGPTIVYDSTHVVSCNGGTNGAIFTTIVGGTQPFQISWNGIPASSSDTIGVAVGTYIIVVTDSNNCTATDTIIVGQPAALNANVTTSPANCGQSNGSAVVQVTGGTQPYVTYQWSGGPTNNDTITGIASGLIIVTVTDAHGCSVIDSGTVANLNGPQITLDSTKDVSCFNGSNGFIYTTITGGSSPYIIKWNGTTTNNSDTINASAGSYTILVTDSTGCTATQTFTISQPSAALVVSVFTKPATCNLNNGIAIAQTTGGTQPYSFQWSVSVTNNDTITGLAPGGVIVTVTDSNGCVATNNGTVSSQPSPQITRDSVINAGCSGGNNGAIYTTITGGTTPLTISWNGNVTNNSDTLNLTASTYIIVVTDSNNCIASDTMVVSQPQQLVATVSTIAATCGQNNGTAIVQVSGGTNPFNYSWSVSAINNDTITGLPTGQVIVTVTDSNNCTAIDSGVVTNLNGPTVIIDSVKNVSCFGGNNGAVYATITGGAFPNTITWNGVVTTSVDTIGAPAGNYIIVVTDNNGCSSSDSDFVLQPTQLTASVTIKNATCGLSNGQAIAVPSGGTPGYTYLWSYNNLNTDTISNLPANGYTVTVTDANGCTTQASGSLNNIAGPSITIDSVINVNCFGESNGAVYTTVNGGTLPYAYSWNGVLSSSGDTLNAALGNYVLVVTDSNNCTAIDSGYVNQPQQLLINVITQPASCGQNNGVAVVQINGGTAPFNYVWNVSLVNNDTLTGLAPGNVVVTVTDAHGCVATDGDTIQNLSGPQISIDSIVNVKCKGGTDGAIYLNITGGTGSVGILWSNSNIGDDNIGILAGTYTITVTDGAGCVVVDSFTVVEPLLALTDSIAITHATCGSNNGSATVTGYGGVGTYTYLWFDNSNSPDHLNLGAGSWTVTVTDGNGCSVTDFAIISNINGPVISVDSIKPVSCYGDSTGAIYVSVNGAGGGFTYLWSDGIDTVSYAQDLINVPAGGYILTVTDANNCISLIDTIVPENLPIDLSFNITPAQCGSPTGSVLVNPSGGGGGPYTYHWSTNATTQFIINLPANPYTVTVTDNLGCSVDSSVTVTNPGAPLVTVVNLINVHCYGENSGSININVSGGIAPYSYIYYLNNTPISFDEDADSLIAGNYYVTVQDSQNCTTTFPFQITQPSQIIISFIITSPSCGDSSGSVVATVIGGTGGYGYLWSDGSTTNSIFNQPAGSDTLTVTDSTGCSVFQVANISNLNGPQIVSVDSTNVTCHGASNGSIIIVATGNGLTYSWTPLGLPPTASLNNLPGGVVYTVKVTDNVGCVTIRPVYIYEPPDITYTAIIPIHNPPYNLTCNSSNDGSIELVNVGGGTPFNAPGVPHYNFLWSPLPSNSPSIFNLSANSYNVTITDSIGCIKNATFILTQPPLITANGGGNLNICGFDSTSMQADTPSYGQGHWVLEQGTGIILSPNLPNTTITGLSIGLNIFSWVVSDGVCTDTSQVIVSVNSSIEAIVGVDRAICDPLVVITATSPQTGTGFWNVISGGGIIANSSSPATAVNGLSQGPNVFQWTVQNGTCVDSARIVITLKDPSECIEPIEMPNGITPNSDGKNDYFFVKGLGDIPNKIEIYNRWGNLVYQKENYDNSWDGKNESGQDLPDGTYFVILNVPSRTVLLKGYVDLRRGAQ